MPFSSTLKLGVLPRRRSGLWYKSAAYLLNNVAPNLIHDYAGQRFWNSVDGPTTFPFQSVRTTNAMQFDPYGKLVWGPANMLTNTDTFGSGWSSTGSSISLAGISSPAGTAYKLIENAASVLHAYQSQAASIVTGQTYTASIHIKAAERGFALFAMAAYFTTTAIQIDLSTGAVTVGTGTPVAYGSQNMGNGWWRVWVTQTATFSGSGSNALLIYTSQDGVWNNRNYLGDGTSGIYMAAAQFEPNDVTSPKVYNTSGSSAYFAPRFDYDPVTLQPRGVLIEETRTNIIGNSNGTVGWVLTDVTPTKTLTGVERVENSAYLMTEGSAGTSIVTPTGAGVTVTAGATVTVSALFKYVNCQWVRIRAFANTGVDGATQWVDIQNGVIGSNTVLGTGAFVSSRITNVGGGWYRVELTATPGPAYTSAIFQIVASPADGSNTRVSGAQWGIQWPMLEEAATASLSIIPTYGGASATRAADNLSASIGAWYNQARGSWYLRATPSYDISSSRRLFTLRNAGGTDLIAAVRSTGRNAQMQTTVASVSNFAPTIGSMGDVTDCKLALRYDTPDKRGSLNGAAVVSSSAVAFPNSGLTEFRVGSSGASSAVLNGWMKEIRYYADASASDAQLQALSA